MLERLSIGVGRVQTDQEKLHKEVRLQGRVNLAKYAILSAAAGTVLTAGQDTGDRALASLAMGVLAYSISEVRQGIKETRKIEDFVVSPHAWEQLNDYLHEASVQGFDVKTRLDLLEKSQQMMEDWGLSKAFKIKEQLLTDGLPAVYTLAPREAYSSLFQSEVRSIGRVHKRDYINLRIQKKAA